MRRRVVIEIEGSYDYIYLFLFEVHKLLEKYHQRGLFREYDLEVKGVDERAPR